MIAFAETIRKNYQTIILIAVVIGLVLGAFTIAPGKTLQNYSQALTFFMILLISLTITPQQFIFVARQPGAVLAGLGLNFLFMPLVCWVLARLFVSNADLATGIILVGVVPCAGMAAVWTALLKGDVPLGMAMSSFKSHPLVGLPVALAFILQMLTASTFYRFLRSSERKRQQKLQGVPEGVD